MRILWIPQLATSSKSWDGSRQFHLLRHLAQRHTVELISWEHASSASRLLRFGRNDEVRGQFGREYHITLAPSFYRLFTTEYPRHGWLALNQQAFRHAVDRVARLVTPDVCVYTASHHATGFPPQRTPAPVLFEYLDFSPPSVAEFYGRQANGIVAVTTRLAGEVARFRRPTWTIPNGVDVARYRSVSRNDAKRQLGVEGRQVVSLIGLTCSSTMYFVNAMAKVARRKPDVLFLYAGSGPAAEAIRSRADEVGLRNIMTPGTVPSADVHIYFAATDVGLYPGDDTPYYRGASPLKIIEYTAAGAQVVTSPVDFFLTGWPNVHTTDPTADAFAEAILRVLDKPEVVLDVSKYDWSRLADDFESALHAVASGSVACVS
jgi:glycosyltransferase involved in cell wall biosynthesis